MTNILDQVRDVDHRWFAAHPDQDDYVRAFIPGEFEPLTDPEPGCMVHVRAWRIDGAVVFRLRTVCPPLH